MALFTYTDDGHIIEYWVDETLPPKKRHKPNRLGEDCHLSPEGRVTRDEDSIRAIQRIWRERVYAPPGTPFATRGTMFRKAMKDWELQFTLK